MCIRDRVYGKILLRIQMVFEYILKQNNLDPKKDLSIDQSIDFGSTAAAFAGETSSDFTEMCIRDRF